LGRIPAPEAASGKKSDQRCTVKAFKKLFGRHERFPRRLWQRRHKLKQVLIEKI